MNILNQVRNLRIADYNYPLPDERIAKHPLAQREQCKVLMFKDNAIEQHIFHEVPALLPSNALLVYNNTRVINARLRFRKATGSQIEIFCLEPVAPRDYQLIFQTTHECTWLCLVGNSKRWKSGPLTQQIDVDGNAITINATRGERRGNAFEIIFSWDGEDVTFASVLEALGEIPIPPYLNRDTEKSDLTDYQTVYSHIDGSVAAPTAGLHFTDELLAECDRRGIERRELTLHVGAGTFQPVKSDNIGDHAMHTEFISVPRDLLAELATTNRPVIAVGTTSVRTLESLYYIGQILEANPEATEEELRVTQWMPYTTPCEITPQQALQNIVDYLDCHNASDYLGSTQLMIAPGYRYRIVKGMITNFHQPQSTLLLLVAAFVGNDNWRTIYEYALNHGFRFLSYGDACLFL
ncbi:MAG: S-adenosylmethionine:tRNA ribosyltransferase-isomerase [Muribaculaceae bacterium]|nr:S-adenosylmethionine:tRNA ribosyltransferase-isomerase [Muribaculaceae bacterium]MBR5171439.1 S-adenosylmethionine:tRNA ribosyltransferase-isomerase [Muribaculaceae bacterium]